MWGELRYFHLQMSQPVLEKWCSVFGKWKLIFELFSQYVSPDTECNDLRWKKYLSPTDKDLHLERRSPKRAWVSVVMMWLLIVKESLITQLMDSYTQPVYLYPLLLKFWVAHVDSQNMTNWSIVKAKERQQWPQRAEKARSISSLPRVSFYCDWLTPCSCLTTDGESSECRGPGSVSALRWIQPVIFIMLFSSHYLIRVCFENIVGRSGNVEGYG